MSYYEDVYLARLNRDGTSRQERIQGNKKRNFERFLEKSVYKVSFVFNYTNYIGTLQPSKANEQDIVNHLLVSKDITLSTGAELDLVTNQGSVQKWIVIYHDKNESLGYNKYKVYLLDRVLTWWDSNKEEHTSYVNVVSSQNDDVRDIFKDTKGTPLVREAQNAVNLIMSYDEFLQKDCYCLLDGSPRAFIVTGFDCETVPNVQYVTLDITMVRDEDNPSTTPISFWGN